MHLVSFRVERCRNILGSGEIQVDRAVTCLVGKNEPGKTNPLHALRTVNPAPTGRDFDEQQYPRRLQKEWAALLLRGPGRAASRGCEGA